MSCSSANEREVRYHPPFLPQTFPNMKAGLSIGGYLPRDVVKSPALNVSKDRLD